MQKRNLYSSIGLSLLLAIVVGCQSTIGTGSSTSSSGGGSITFSTAPWTANQVVATSSFFIGVQGIWTGGATVSFSDTSCIVPFGTAPGGPQINCTIAVPELTLHYSDLVFQIGTSVAGTCSLVEFQPFYFRHSAAAGYTPEGGTAAVDCSGATLPIPTACWGGVGPAIVTSNFPTNSGLFFVPGANLANGFKAVSSYAQGQTDITSDLSILRTNTYISNNNLTPAVARTVAGNGVDYVASSKIDYSATCLDTFGNPLYSLKLVIVSSFVGAPNYYAW